MTKDTARVDPIPNEDPQRDPKKPFVDPGKPLDTAPKDDEELSEEDLKLKNELDMLVARLKESNTSLHPPSLEALRTLIRTSTSSMTSVPKPLKFLRAHFPDLKQLHDRWVPGKPRQFLADICSVLCMTYADEGSRDALRYRLLGLGEDAGSWGHEYVRHLAAELGDEYAHRVEHGQDTAELLALAKALVPFFLAHNAEADAVDLLLELEAIDQLVPFVDHNTFARVALYMVSCVPYLPYPEDEQVLRAAHAIYRKVDRIPEALILAMRLDDKALVQQDFDACTDATLRRQLAFMLARLAYSVETNDETEQEILANAKLAEHFGSLARELGILDPKTPEDIYKTHLETRSAYSIDSAKQNLASSIVNGFVNAAFNKDKLMLTDSEQTGTAAAEKDQWIYKNKDHAMMSATASLGLLMLWDVEAGLAQIDKYMYSNEEYVKAGALLAVGMVSANVKNEADPAMALLSEHITEGASSSLTCRIAAISGLGMAYAGSARADLVELLSPLVVDAGEVSCTAALALGQILVGTCDGDVTSTILQVLMEHPDVVHAKTRFLGLGLALLYLGKQEACEATLETLKAIDSPVSRGFQVLVDACAYAGTGNVLKVQAMTRLCGEHLSSGAKDDEADDKKKNASPTAATPNSSAPGAADAAKSKEDEKNKKKESAPRDDFQGYATLGIALIAMGEDVGSEMALRTYNHLMHYGEPVIRRAVPLAIALQCASNPLVHVLDTLSKYSHDHDQDVAVNAIFAMGVVGAGTNNARLAQMLRQLASYYNKDPSCLFMVRVAQGLIHMGKGTMTLNPYVTNRTLMSRVGVAGLVTVLLALCGGDAKELILGKNHWLVYHLALSMYPRFLITLDDTLAAKSVSVRVGQAVDVVGQAGRPKTITGFQTHNTPVLMAYGERAELATDEFVSLAPVLEGFVIIKKNPDFMETDKD